MATIGIALGTALSLMARKAAAFDFLAQKELMINFYEDPHLHGGFWVDKEDHGVCQRGLYPTALEAVEAFMKDGEGK